jgi:TfoX/Sxy family transcriptional regulator of competence genes
MRKIVEQQEEEVKQKRKYTRRQKVITLRGLKSRLSTIEATQQELNAAVEKALQTYDATSPVVKMYELELAQVSGAIGIIQRMIWEIEDK